LRAAISALRRSMIARTASPGLEALDRSILGLFSTAGRWVLPLPRPPFWK
jgi:hypothetical protein